MSADHRAADSAPPPLSHPSKRTAQQRAHAERAHMLRRSEKTLQRLSRRWYPNQER